MSDPSGRRRGAGSALLGFLAVAAIAGVMVTVGVAPAIALTGVAAKNGIGLFEDLPSDLKIVPLQQKTEIYAKSGSKNVQIASFYNQNRDVITWSQVPASVKNATIAGEDVRFYQHGGVDPMGILRATVANALGKNIQGASTITQQYVKNVCVQQAELLPTPKQVQAAYYNCTQEDLGRKAKEMRLAIGLEKKYTKNQILLGYLNIAGFGGNIYGIESAARYYFDVHASQLTDAQAAALIAIVNQPTALRLDQKANLPANTARRNYILGSELSHHLISQSAYDTAMASVTKTTITPSQAGCQSAGSAGFFCNYIVDTIRNNPEFGATRSARDQNLESAGWKIYTTLDLKQEKKAQAAMNSYVLKKTPVGNIGGASTSVQVGTGRILTMVQSKIFNDSGNAAALGAQYTAVNYNTDVNYGGSTGFQAGSTYKLFTLLDWLKKGHGLNDVVDGSARTIQPSSFTYCGAPYTGQAWPVGNDTANEGGRQSVLQATAASVNGAFASMAEQLDLCDIRKMAQSFDVHRADLTPLQDYAPTIIGTNEVAPLTMVTAYAGVLNDGMTCTPIAIDKVITPTGSSIPVPKTNCTRSIDTQTAIAAQYALRRVITNGTGGPANPGDGQYVMAKTGTTDSAHSTWVVGGTNKTATAVWVGNISGTTNLRQVAPGPVCESTMVAASMRYCLFRDIQGNLDKAYPGATTGQTPEPQYLYGSSAAQSVPNVAGLSEQDAENVLMSNGYAWAIGATVSSSEPAGTIAYSSPGAGAAAPAHTQVTIYPSDGSGTGTNGATTGATPSPSATPTSATVPNVVTQSPGQAQATLQAAGFSNVNITYHNRPVGQCQVSGQDPTPQSSQPTTTTINLTVIGRLDQNNQCT